MGTWAAPDSWTRDGTRGTATAREADPEGETETGECGVRFGAGVNKVPPASGFERGLDQGMDCGIRCGFKPWTSSVADWKRWSALRARARSHQPCRAGGKPGDSSLSLGGGLDTIWISRSPRPSLSKGRFPVRHCT